MLEAEKLRPSPLALEAVRAKYPTEKYIDQALLKKMGRRPGPPHRCLTAKSAAEQIARFLKSRVPEPFSVSEFKTLAGGASKEQFAFLLEWRDKNGAPQSQRLVLRMQPSESIVETHRLREFQVVKALKGYLPVPEVFWVDPDGEAFDQPALIMGFCEGVTRQPSKDGISRPRTEFSPELRSLLAPQFVEGLAKLARFDWSNSDLSAFDKPSSGTKEDVIWALNTWLRIWEEDAIEEVPLISVRSKWLRENAPQTDHISIVHGDLKAGNFLFNPADGRITAFLDWELVRLGDRHEDIAYLLNPMYAGKDEEGAILVGAFMPREEFLQTYERVSGLPVDPKRLLYYDVFCNWRMAIISLGTAPRVVQGQKTHQDIRICWHGPINGGAVCLHGLHESLRKVL